jgi:hypothetical protein
LTCGVLTPDEGVVCSSARVLDDQAIAAEQEGEIDVDGRRRRVVGSRSSGSSIHVCWMWLALCDKRVADKSRIDSSE